MFGRVLEYSFRKPASCVDAAAHLLHDLAGHALLVEPRVQPQLLEAWGGRGGGGTEALRLLKGARATDGGVKSPRVPTTMALPARPPTRFSGLNEVRRRNISKGAAGKEGEGAAGRPGCGRALTRLTRAWLLPGQRAGGGAGGRKVRGRVQEWWWSCTGMARAELQQFLHFLSRQHIRENRPTALT